ncbi:RNA polymerase sigma factor [Ferruginibacter sp. SUN106]|uniref:RNA polymerase sigma factor n=1 Tax=Ferruginibacter sp. SUN106 TaxID=2978348 RepID=UPI003D35B200
MERQELIPHLFRTEYSKITAVLCKLFGIEHIEIAEDIASETFLSAFETWNYKGIPANPTAWLYVVAKNKARNYFIRNRLFAEKIAKQIPHSNSEEEEIQIDLSEKNITDSQLQMLFAICQPGITTAAQVGLALRILCGFSIDEIADAFLTNKDTINKRLFRAKEKLRLDKVLIEFPDNAAINNRLDIVLKTLYLLFNEGYYSERQDTIVRKELCLEAMRLTYLLIENESTNQHATNALLALMCFHASRLNARTTISGAMILYPDQDEKLWDDELIARGNYFLQQAAKWNIISKYYLEASIAYWHTIKTDSTDKWENILQLYNHLLQLEYSPIAALNRTFALSKARGKIIAIAEAEKLHLTDNHFYYILLGELYKEIDIVKTKLYFQQALSLAKTQTEKQLIQNKIYML